MRTIRTAVALAALMTTAPAAGVAKKIHGWNLQPGFNQKQRCIVSVDQAAQNEAAPSLPQRGPYVMIATSTDDTRTKICGHGDFCYRQSGVTFLTPCKRTHDYSDTQDGFE